MQPLLLLLTATSVLADLDDICGYAPLCGDEDTYFDWETGIEPDYFDGDVILGAELELTDCCKLSDTEPTQDCEIVNPSGESFRVWIANEPICGDGGEDCQEDTCDNYQLVINAQFETTTTSDGCCDSCSCFGDPQCIPFSGSDDMQTWILCDGREIPTGSGNYCPITEDQCSQETDHAGNTCVYLAEDDEGEGWTVGMLGSPCIPNPDSPASTILMYSVPDESFNLTLEQGERGIITDVYLTLACGYFTLNAETCLADGEDAWTYDDSFSALPDIFSFNDVVHGYDEHWSIVDPDSGISIIIRCHGNHYDDDDTMYVPRINVEDISDPSARSDSDGFCVTGEFDTGSATTSNTEEILDGEYCSSALEDNDERLIYRAICQNSALPSSAIESCIYHFCSANYIPMFDSITACQEEFEESPAEGFCGGIVYSDDDYDKCIEQWYDLGAVETITQYYDDREGCTTDVLTELETCQDGVYLQYYRSDQWNDEIAIPVDFCSDEPIILSYCDYQYLFNRQIRIVQKSSGTLCGAVSQCTAVEGFIAKITLVQNTPYPTQFPTDSPTTDDVPSPAPVVSSAPTVCVDDGLCGSGDEYVDYEDYEFSIDMPGCCPNTCYEGEDPSEKNRTSGVNDWFCGYSEEAEGSVEDSILGEDCEDDYTLTIQVAFEPEDCCSKCTCYGDPRCYSFDNVFEEFILCDGRTPQGDNTDERCVIRRDTCLEQTDQSGNVCAWTNPNTDVPDYDDDDTQYEAENDFSVALYGSPCRYDTSASDTPIITMYDTDNFLLEVEQGERGYIQSVTLALASGEFSISASDCLDGDDWEEVSGDSDGIFSRVTYGNEYVWTAEDPTTGIIVKIRCTGHMIDNDYTTMFINVDALYEFDEDRMESGDGFCATNEMTEKALASTDYTQSLVDEGFCDEWNEDTTAVMKRNIARIITDTPGVTNTGTEYAYTTFCQNFYLPQWSSVSACAEDFVDANEVSEMIELFCMAVTTETGACQEDLEVVAEEGGYISAFVEGYETYVVNYEMTCEVDMDDLGTELVQDEDTCETGVELQWYNPRVESWIVYAVFPYDLPCSGYSVTVNYDDHPKLFKNPLRLVQSRNYDYCNSCVEIAGVVATFEFET